MSFSVKPAPFKSSDYEDCIQIRKKVFVQEQNVPENLEIAHEEESIHFLGRIENTAVCTGRLRYVKQKNHLKFERIATLKSYRGQGFGAKLMHAMQEYAQDHFYEAEWLMGAQSSALSFYENLGWQKENDKTFLDAGIEHHLLVLPKEK